MLDKFPHGVAANCPLGHAVQLQHWVSRWEVHAAAWYCPAEHVEHGVQKLFRVPEHTAVRNCPAGHDTLHGLHTASSVLYVPPHGVEA